MIYISELNHESNSAQAAQKPTNMGSIFKFSSWKMYFIMIDIKILPNSILRMSEKRTIYKADFRTLTKQWSWWKTSKKPAYGLSSMRKSGGNWTVFLGSLPRRRTSSSERGIYLTAWTSHEIEYGFCCLGVLRWVTLSHAPSRRGLGFPLYIECDKNDPSNCEDSDATAGSAGAGGKSAADMTL